MNRVMKKISGISTKTKLTFVIIMLSLSLTSMIAMKYFTAVEIPEEEVLKPVLPDSGGNLELDPHFIKVTQIREDVRNVLFVIDSSEKEGIEPAGYYILSIDLSKNLIRVVSVEKDLIIHTKNDKDLMLSEVTSTFGIVSTLNELNRVLELDMRNYLVLDYQNLLWVLNSLNLVRMKSAPMDEFTLYDKSEYYQMVFSPVEERYLAFHMESKYIDDLFKDNESLNMVLSDILFEFSYSLPPIVMRSFLDQAFKEVDTSMQKSIFTQFVVQLQNSNLGIMRKIGNEDDSSIFKRNIHNLHRVLYR
jgi:hypothetical protein